MHNRKAAWIWRVLHELEADGWIVLGDKGYQGAQGALTPYKGRGKPDAQKDANRAHAQLRGRGERAFAQLKMWKILNKQRCCPFKTGLIVRAVFCQLLIICGPHRDQGYLCPSIIRTMSSAIATAWRHV